MIAGDEDILRLDIAMHHSLRVRVAQRVDDFPHEPGGFLNRELTRARQSRAKIFADDERHRVVEERSLCSRGEKRNDMGMLKARSELDLAPEAISVDSRGKVGWKNFYDDLPVELDIGRHEHTRHAGAAKLVFYMVC